MMPLLFLFEQGKKTADGHLKQTTKGLRNNLFILFGLRNIKKYMLSILLSSNIHFNVIYTFQIQASAIKISVVQKTNIKNLCRWVG